MARNSRNIIFLGLIIISFFSFLGGYYVFRTTHWGPWAFSDSSAYLSAAKNLSSGRGLIIIHSTGKETQVTEFPPLLPILLSFISGKDGDYVQAARWLNIVFFSGSILLTGVIILLSTHNLLLSSLGSLIMAVSPLMLQIFSGLMSEPLFIFLLLLLVLITFFYHKSGKASLFYILTGLSALLPIIRYAGIVFIISIGFLLFIVKKEGFLIKIKRTILYWAVSFLPIATWFVYLFRNYRKVGGKRINFDSSFLQEIISSIRDEINLIRSWIPYYGLYKNIWVDTVIFSAVLLTFTLLIVIFSIHWIKKPTIRKIGTYSLMMTNLLLVIPYIFFIAITHTFTIPQIDIIDRMMSPIFPPLILIFSAGIQILIENHKKSYNSLIIFAVGLLISRNYFLTMRNIVREYENNGYGYTAREFQQSGIIEAIKDLPQDQRMISNSAGFVLFYTNRYPFQIDQFFNYQYGSGNWYGEKSFRERNAALILLYSDFHNYYGDQSEKLLNNITEGLQRYYLDKTGGIYFYPD